MAKINNPYDIYEINSFVHIASKEEIISLYNEYKDNWIKGGILTYYAEDFEKYQNSAKLNEGLEPFILWQIYKALNNILY